MRTTLWRLAIVAAAWWLGVAGAALAGDRGSMEDQMACTPDVYRLCSSYVPDEDAITTCLRQNLRALSPACKQVFTRPSPPANKGDNND